MADLNGFDANTTEPAAPLEAMPAGKYPAVLVESEMATTKAGDGQRLALTFQIVDGPYKNRKLWANLNLVNPNPTAVQIARAELSALCRSVGVLTPKDSSQLHNIPLMLTVKTRTYEGELKNEVKGFEPMQRTAPGSAPAQTMPAQTANAAPGAKPGKAPWIK